MVQKPGTARRCSGHTLMTSCASPMRPRLEGVTAVTYSDVDTCTSVLSRRMREGTAVDSGSGTCITASDTHGCSAALQWCSKGLAVVMHVWYVVDHGKSLAFIPIGQSESSCPKHLPSATRWGCVRTSLHITITERTCDAVQRLIPAYLPPGTCAAHQAVS